jgi:VIT1/CCC1 family predicted Fe2+/Mn2+ transporter
MDAELLDHHEPHKPGTASRLNWLRAGVLGANDGIVSTAGIVIGVAGATNQTAPIVTAGVAGLAAGAMSMAVGEYVSVSSQRDSERALLSKERRELRETPEEELAELAGMYAAKGLTREVAQSVAEQLTAVDALAAHAEVELGINPEELAHPGHAAWASFLSFVVGALLPLLAIALLPISVRVTLTVFAVALALMLTGLLSARLGQSRWQRPVLRNVLGGALAMAVTYAIGTVVGHAV